MDDKCTACNGRGTWEVSEETTEEELDSFLKFALQTYPGAKITAKCDDCNATGKESVRLTWEVDKLDPQKHDFTIYCSSKTPCWYCDELKEKHRNNE
jgi:hypothetical protein